MKRSPRYPMRSAAPALADRKNEGRIFRTLGLGALLALILSAPAAAQSCYGRPDVRHLSIEMIDMGGRTGGGVHLARDRWLASAWWGQIRGPPNQLYYSGLDDRGPYLAELRCEALGLRARLGSRIPAGTYTVCVVADATRSTNTSVREARLYLDPFGPVGEELEFDLDSAGYSTLTAQLEATVGRRIGSRVWPGIGAIVRRSWFMPEGDFWTVNEGVPIDARVFLALGGRVGGPVHVAARYTIRVWESRVRAWDRKSNWLETTIGVLF